MYLNKSNFSRPDVAIATNSLVKRIKLMGREQPHSRRAQKKQIQGCSPEGRERYPIQEEEMSTEKNIDLTKTVAELVAEDPQIRTIMAELGFTEILRPEALQAMGTVMTIPKGAVVKGIPMERIVQVFREAGYTVSGLPQEQSAQKAQEQQRVLDLELPVARLVEQYPEVADILYDQGLHQIRDRAALHFMGQKMTIPKGARLRGVKLEGILGALEAAGFTLKNLPQKKVPTAQEQETNDRLKALILRLENGEDLERVRADFVREFSSVSVHQIVSAEQGLISDGVPVQEVQRLCDLHSALFHGKTEAEVWREEEAQLQAQGESTPATEPAAQRGEQVPTGHPVDVLRRENRALQSLLDETERHLRGGNRAALAGDFLALKKLRVLYGKKEEILMPILGRHGITGPIDVMWGVDDEIKAEVSRLQRELSDALSLPEQTAADCRAVLARIREMIYKEENIFFPLCLENFTREEWLATYADLPEMGPVFIDSAPIWEEGERGLAERREQEQARKREAMRDGVLHLDGGTLTVEQLEGVLSLLPVDVTFIDDQEINRYFKNSDRVFSRPSSALGRSVYECHPAQVRPMVQELIADFKAGKRDRAEIWTPSAEHPVRILYCAVRSAEGRYLGTVELVQDMTAVREHFLGK